VDGSNYFSTLRPWPQTTPEVQELGTDNFRLEGGDLYLVRCFHCEPLHGRKNLSTAAPHGRCGWCGWHDPIDEEE